MIELTGKYETAKIFNDFVEPEAIKQIFEFINHPMSKNSSVRIMPDVHAGRGCVIGYTALLTDKLVPNLVGADIGCGITAWNLGKIKLTSVDFQEFDRFIRDNIPSGRDVNNYFQNLSYSTAIDNVKEYFISSEINAMVDKIGMGNQNFLDILGTLGSGNHFLELDIDSSENIWLVIHSGSRKAGNLIAKYHQNKAIKKLKDNLNRKIKIEEIKKKFTGKDIETEIKKLNTEKIKVTGLEYLQSSDLSEYLDDMKFAQKTARINRAMMGYKILNLFFHEFKPMISRIPITIESIHNYIDFQRGIIRKGAISANDHQGVIIPLNMADGILIGYGKGNPDWNYSAPHGAGRIMSRSKAKKEINIDDFKNIMQTRKIWSNCVNAFTLDESPFAYKNSEEIIKYIEPTVQITERLRPIFSFKASN